MIDMAARAVRVALLVVGVQQSGAKIAFDAVSGDQRVQIGARIEREFPELACVRPTQGLFQPFLVAAQADVELPAVSARRAPGEPGLLQKNDLDAALGEAQR